MTEYDLTVKKLRKSGYIHVPIPAKPLTFTTQKKNNHGMIIAHACPNNVLCCPAGAATCQLLLHRSTFSCLNVSVKLASYYSSQQVNMPVKAPMITHTMPVHAATLDAITGITPKNLSVCSLFEPEERWPCCRGAAIQVLSNCWPIGRVIQ